MTDNITEGDGLLRLAVALASNNQHKENEDIVKWLDAASVDDLRLAFPVLLNWCRNSLKKAAKAGGNSLKETMKAGDEKQSPSDVVLTPTTSTEEVAQKVVKVLEEAIEFDTEDSDTKDLQQQKNHSVSSLRMALAGYLHTNHDKMRKFPTVTKLEERTKAKVAFDRAATNTLNMVNASGQNSMSISQYIKPEEESSRGWGIPHIHIDLGLGLQQASTADVAHEYIRDNKTILHPFTGEKVGRMEIKKVIPSKRRPVWVEYFSSDDTPLKPDILTKQGDDLRNDHAVSVVSKLCETIWAKAPIEWTTGTPPTVCAYDVLVTAADAGYLEMVPGKNFLDLTKNKDNIDWGAVDLRKLAPSLVGSYIVNFILGVRDRHEDNMMVVGDLQENPRMMQIDFGYILMEFPGGVHYDLPRLTMPIPLVDRFNSEPGRKNGETTLMEDLQHDMLAAYLVLRRHSTQLIPFCAHLMSSSYDYKYVESVLKGRHVFRTDRSETKVIKWMSQKLIIQWAHFYFRREFKAGMVSMFYKFVELTSFESSKKKDEEQKDEAPGLRGRIQSLFLRSEKSVTNQEEIDMSNVNERVNDAMKLQKQVSKAMIFQKEKEGTLQMKDFDGGNDDDNESVHSEEDNRAKDETNGKQE